MFIFIFKAGFFSSQHLNMYIFCGFHCSVALNNIVQLCLCLHSHEECGSQSISWEGFLCALHHFCVPSTGNDLVLTVVLCLYTKDNSCFKSNKVYSVNCFRQPENDVDYSEPVEMVSN